MVVGDQRLPRVHAQKVRAEEAISGGVTMPEDEEVLAISS
jgi:hypothetical protein